MAEAPTGIDQDPEWRGLVAPRGGRDIPTCGSCSLTDPGAGRDS